MSQYALRLPNSLMQAARDYAELDNVSMNQFFVVAIAEKIAALNTEQFFQKKAALADEEAYFQILAKVKNGVSFVEDTII
jgi:hypothetical protein